MKYNREYEIAWQGLKPGPHTYLYEIDDKFMRAHEADENFNGWDAKVKVIFDKHESFFMLHFDIDGSVIVPCDRCGDDFKLKLWDEFDLLIKLLGEEAGDIEEEDDAVFIPRSETVIDISKWLYEYLMLSIPLQRIHPDKADNTSGCNPDALDLLDKLSDHDDDEIQNPIWKGLDKLKTKS